MALALVREATHPDRVVSEVEQHLPTADRVVIAGASPRVRLTPGRLPAERSDGAWWPRSASLSAELPGLLRVLFDRLGRPVMVGYREHDWTDTPPLIEVDGTTVHLVGFAGDESAAVILVGHDGGHLTLRVIAPETAEREAMALLRAVRQGDHDGQVAGTGSAAARSISEVADRLAGREDGADEQRRAEIYRWCVEAAERFEDAPIQSFVPTLVEHIVRNRTDRDRRLSD